MAWPTSLRTSATTLIGPFLLFCCAAKYPPATDLARLAKSCTIAWPSRSRRPVGLAVASWALFSTCIRFLYLSREDDEAPVTRGAPRGFLVVPVRAARSAACVYPLSPYSRVRNSSLLTVD